MTRTFFWPNLRKGIIHCFRGFKLSFAISLIYLSSVYLSTCPSIRFPVRVCSFVRLVDQVPSLPIRSLFAPLCTYFVPPWFLLRSFFVPGFVPSSFLLRSFFVPSSCLLRSFFVPSSFLLCSFFVPSSFPLRSFFVPSSFLLRSFFVPPCSFLVPPSLPFPSLYFPSPLCFLFPSLVCLFVRSLVYKFLQSVTYPLLTLQCLCVIQQTCLSFYWRFQVDASSVPQPKCKEEFTGMMGNLARALDERHKVMHSSGNVTRRCSFLVLQIYNGSVPNPSFVSWFQRRYHKMLAISTMYCVWEMVTWLSY